VFYVLGVIFMGVAAIKFKNRAKPKLVAS